MFTEALLIIVTNCEQPKYPSEGNCLNYSFCIIKYHTSLKYGQYLYAAIKRPSG